MERLQQHGRENGSPSPVGLRLLRLLAVLPVCGEHHDRDRARAVVEPGGAVPGAVLRAGHAVEEDAIGLKPTNRALQGITGKLVQAGDVVALVDKDGLDDLGDVAVIVDAQDTGLVLISRGLGHGFDPTACARRHARTPPACVTPDYW